MKSAMTFIDLAKCIKGVCHSKNKHKTITKEDVIDTYEFRLGFWCSHQLVTYAIASIYCVLVPYVVFFALPFFFMKYAIDKYNLVFRYRPSFEGSGLIRHSIKPVTVLIIIMAQLFNCAVMSSLIDTSYYA
jgi:hypothetical protein